MDNNIKELVPVDIQLSKNVNSDFSDNKKIAKDNKISIENTLTNNGFDYKTNFKDIVKFNTYEADKGTVISRWQNSISFWLLTIMKS